MFNRLKKLDKWLDLHSPLLFILLILFLLRVPNFFEPYWYGDEAIYLTLGNALKQGSRLYTEIIDHKTPLIYYLAMVPSQLWFRVLLLGWMTAATIAFHRLAQIILNKRLWSCLATLLFVVLTSIPWFEGNIPNGELFVMGFVLVGANLLINSSFFSHFLDGKNTIKINKHESLWLLSAGFMFGLGVLTKVPAVLDAIAFFSIGWFTLSNYFLKKKKKFSLQKKDIQKIKITTQNILLLVIGLVTPILISIGYFVLRGSGQAYLDYGLLYNFRYADYWQLAFNSPILLFFFSFSGKIVLLVLLGIGLSLLGLLVTPQFQFIAIWFGLALVGSTLSNRPYPHYFLQLIPALSLLIVYYIQTVIKKSMLQTVFATILIAIFISVLSLLQVRPYATYKYYKNFTQFLTGSISLEEYNASFDQLMTDNYKAARVIKDAGCKRIFIWGTNPTLYALSGTAPSGRFTVSFHIKDFDAFEETLESVKQNKPKFIIIMKNETHPFPELIKYVQQNYIRNSNFIYFDLWKRQTAL